MEVTPRHWVGVAAVTAVSCLFALGLRYTPDSLHYLAVARGLLSGAGLSGTLLAVDLPIPRPLDLWPPLYPLALAAGLGAGLGPDATAMLVNVLSMALLSGALFSLAPAGQGARYTWSCAALIILYRPFGHVVTYAWSEPLCIALLALALALEVRSGTARSGKWLSFWTGVALGAAVLTRYAAAFALPALGVERLLRMREDPGARRHHLMELLALGAGWLLLVAPWLARNLSLFGGLLGTPHAPRSEGFIDSLLSGVSTLLGDASFGAFGLLCVTSVPWLSGRAPPKSLQGLRPAALLSVSYFLCLFWTATRTHMDALDNRLLAPMGVGLIPLIAAVLVEILQRTEIWRAPSLAVTGLILIAGHLWSPVRERLNHPRRGLASLRKMITPVPDWVETHVTERDLLLGPQLWFVHPFSPAPVVAHGYPERGLMTLASLGPFLKQHRHAYERFFWLDVKPPPVSSEEFEVVEVERLATNPYWSTVWNTVWRIRLRE
ncbi:MAG TPA: hypothetical protein VF794_33760 [Archangium sp.]|jgi:hypothetical protein|uniref:hypothetical protein n=1 Tax=Archangium sp. TaxID=1872627 RepID=UPI002EDA2E60